jgi:hypothetical protein
MRKSGTIGRDQHTKRLQQNICCERSTPIHSRIFNALIGMKLPGIKIEQHSTERCDKIPVVAEISGRYGIASPTPEI